MLKRITKLNWGFQMSSLSWRIDIFISEILYVTGRRFRASGSVWHAVYFRFYDKILLIRIREGDLWNHIHAFIHLSAKLSKESVHQIFLTFDMELQLTISDKNGWNEREKSGGKWWKIWVTRSWPKMVLKDQNVPDISSAREYKW